MTIDEKKKEELKSKKNNFASNLKLFWENCQKNWIWINIGAWPVYTIFIWFIYIINRTSLLYTIIMSIVPPLAIILVGYIYKNSLVKNTKYLILLSKFFLVGVGGFVLAGIIWLFAGYILITAPRPLIKRYLLPEWLDYYFLLILLVVLYAIVGFFLYRFGKKRDWHIFAFY